MTTPPAESNPLVGIWKLLSAIAIYPDGSIDAEAYGANPTGYITYTAEGHMMVMFAKSDRPPFSRDVRSPLSEEMSAVAIEELAHALTSFNAYAGTYTLDGNIVSHHLTLASIPNRVGATLVRTFTISENRLILRTPATQSDGVLTVFELTWEKL
jgi:hypothetical protein